MEEQKEAVARVVNKYLPQLAELEQQHGSILASLENNTSLDEETLLQLSNFVVQVGLSTRDLINPLWEDLCLAETELLVAKRKLVKSKMAVGNIKSAINKFNSVIK